MEKKSLLELLNKELEDFPNYITSGYSSIEDFITDDKKSADFINHLLYDDEKIFDEYSIYKISHGRARHSVISFLFGLVIGEFDNLFGSLSSSLNDCSLEYINYINEPYINYWLWMLTSTNHDYGYFSAYLSKDIDLKSLKHKYDLFDDNIFEEYEPLKNYENKYPKVLKHTYEMIYNYFNYSKYYHTNIKKDKEELCDHGILGGCLIYDRTLKRIISKLTNEKIDYSYSLMNREYSVRDILLYKTACLTIAQHNIFKSINKKTDLMYEKFNLQHLFHNSNYFIDDDTPILALLSLVDTIECIKTFSKAELKNNYLETLTILKSIKLSIDANNILIDLNDFYIAIEDRNNKNLKEIFQDYKKNIMSLDKWTNYNVIELEKNIIVISHKNITDVYEKRH